MRPARVATALLVCLAVGAVTIVEDAAARKKKPVVARVEPGVRDCANRARLAAGLPALLDSPALDGAAKLHAKNMARFGFFDHTDQQGRDPHQRASLFAPGAFSTTGENIAAGRWSADATCSDWLNSPGHRANILDPDFSYIGGGFARGGRFKAYWVQTFGGNPQPIVVPGPV